MLLTCLTETGPSGAGLPVFASVRGAVSDAEGTGPDGEKDEAQAESRNDTAITVVAPQCRLRRAAIEDLQKMRGEFSAKDWQKIAELTGQASGSAAAVQRAAQILGVNLSTRKVAQVAPFVGAAVGAGVNAAFQNDVAAAARFAYRARWLEVNEGLIEGGVE